MAWPPSNPLDVSSLPSSILSQGDMSSFLARFVEGWQDEADSIVQRIVTLPYMLDAFRIEVVQGTDGRTTLDYALWLVGFTDDLEQVVSQLSDAQKRLLLRSAAALWKAKGLPRGWMRWIRLLTGRCAWYADYFHWRHLLDEDLIGETSCLDPFEPAFPAGEDYGAYESDLVVEDPQDTDVQQLIVDLVDLTRPLSERIRVRWPDVLEIWDRDAVLSRWERSGVLSLDTTEQEMSLEVVGGVYAAIHQSKIGTAFAHYTVQAFFRATSVATELQLDLHWQDATHWVAIRLDFVAETVSVVRQNGGAETVHVAVSPVPWPVLDVDYTLTVSLNAREPAGFCIAAAIDGEAVVSYETNAPYSASGYPGWTCRLGSAVVGRFMAWDPPLEYNWVAPSGALDDEA